VDHFTDVPICLTTDEAKEGTVCLQIDENNGPDHSQSNQITDQDHAPEPTDESSAAEANAPPDEPLSHELPLEAAESLCNATSNAGPLSAESSRPQSPLMANGSERILAAAVTSEGGRRTGGILTAAFTPE
jgi:hypothetical protein